MEKLFKAFLEPKMYQERNVGITNSPEKIAKYLASNEYNNWDELNILSYRDTRLSDYWYFPPCCARTPELRLVLSLRIITVSHEVELAKKGERRGTQSLLLFFAIIIACYY